MVVTVNNNKYRLFQQSYLNSMKRMPSVHKAVSMVANVYGDKEYHTNSWPREDMSVPPQIVHWCSEIDEHMLMYEEAIRQLKMEDLFQKTTRILYI
jgi:hypothetical protein